MDPNTFTVGGQKVTVKAEIPAKAAPRLPAQVIQFGVSSDVDDLVRVLTQVLESWEFDGDPRDSKAYQDLDVYDEIIPIGEKAIRVLNTRIEDGRQAVVDGDEPNVLVAGEKRFTIRPRIPLSVASKLPAMLVRHGQTGDIADLLKILTLVADQDRTDLVANAADARSYLDLDLLSRLMPLGEKVIAYLNQKLEYARTKN